MAKERYTKEKIERDGKLLFYGLLLIVFGYILLKINFKYFVEFKIYNAIYLISVFCLLGGLILIGFIVCKYYLKNHGGWFYRKIPQKIKNSKLFINFIF